MKRLLLSFKTQVLYVTDVNMSKSQSRNMAGHIKNETSSSQFRKPGSSCQRCKDCCSPSHQHSTFHFQYVLLRSTFITQTDPVRVPRSWTASWSGRWHLPRKAQRSHPASSHSRQPALQVTSSLCIFCSVLFFLFSTKIEMLKFRPVQHKLRKKKSSPLCMHISCKRLGL